MLVALAPLLIHDPEDTESGTQTTNPNPYKSNVVRLRYGAC